MHKQCIKLKMEIRVALFASKSLILRYCVLTWQGRTGANLDIRLILSRELYATLFVVFERFDLTGRSIALIVVAKISSDGAVLLVTREHTN